MGVYIPGMEMPKGCAFCRIKRRNGKKTVCPLCNEEWDIHDPMSADFRLDNCPLVPVPPHGRLIDADVLGFVLMDCENADQALWRIDEAPTIIPADPAEEDKL